MFRYFHENRTARHVSQLFFNYDGDADVMHVYDILRIQTAHFYLFTDICSELCMACSAFMARRMWSTFLSENATKMRNSFAWCKYANLIDL